MCARPTFPRSMSETVDTAAYGELLGEYLVVVNEIAPLLDETGRPAPGFEEEYTQLRRRKEAIRAAMQSVDRDGTDVGEVLEDAFVD